MSEAIYRRIMRDIRDKIASGEFAPGDPLPPTRELVSQYGVAAATVRQAITLLTETGELTGQQGKAVYVAQPKG